MDIREQALIHIEGLLKERILSLEDHLPCARATDSNEPGTGDADICC